MVVINGWLSESHFGGSAVEDSILKTESQHKLTRTHTNQLSKWQERQGTWGKKGGGLKRRGNRQSIGLRSLINAFYTIDI